jgi:hypothetical protein
MGLRRLFELARRGAVGVDLFLASRQVDFFLVVVDVLGSSLGWCLISSRCDCIWHHHKYEDIEREFYRP